MPVQRCSLCVEIGLLAAVAGGGRPGLGVIQICAEDKVSRSRRRGDMQGGR